MLLDLGHVVVVGAEIRGVLNQFVVLFIVVDVFGVAAVDSLDLVEGDIDVVNVFRRPATAPEIARLAGEIGARALWMQPGAENDLAAEIALDGGLDVVNGPCIMVQHRLWSLRQLIARPSDGA